MKNKLPLPFLILCIPIVFGMTQYVPDDQPLFVLFAVSVISIFLCLKPVKYFSDLFFFFLFQITCVLSIYFYANLFFEALFLKLGIGEHKFMTLDTTFYLALFCAFILSIILIIVYHSHRDEKKKAFELSFSIVLAVISNINIIN